MKNRIQNTAVAFFLCLIGISAAMVIVFGLIENVIDKAENNIYSEDEFSYSGVPEGSLYYENAWYRSRDSLETVLILGLDKKQKDSSQERKNS